MSINSVFVLGMHRSGTSALAGALSCLGIQFLSSNDELFQAIDNPKGFFERPSVVKLSDDLLKTQDWTWDSVDLNPFDMDQSIEFIHPGRQLISQFLAEGPVGLKDPRICSLMPFWRRALLDRFEAVVITRDPAEVAWSLHVRNGLPIGTGLALWIAYSTHLANGIQGMNPHILRYENLVDSPTTELASITRFLHDRGTPVLQQETDIEVAAKSIDPTLRRATFPEWINSHPLTIEARSIRELFHQAPGINISFRPSELCREILDSQLITKKYAEVNQELNLARIQLGQEQLENTNTIRTFEARMSELNDVTSALQHELDLRNSELEQTRRQLEQTTDSSCQKSFLLRRWPERKLRRSNRS